MKQKIVVLSILSSLAFTACESSPKTNSEETKNPAGTEVPKENQLTDISYTIAKNYFVNNGVKNIYNPKIETAEKFNEFFGMATTMDKDGKPSLIDFTKQNTITVILPETDLLTTIQPVSLKKNYKNEIIFSYQAIVGQKQSYTSRPFLLLIVDKLEDGTVRLQEIK